MKLPNVGSPGGAVVASCSVRPLVAMLVAATALGLWAQQASAATDWGADVGIGVLETDNLFRTVVNERSATIRHALANFSAQQTSRTVDFDIDGGVDHREYGMAGISDDTLPILNGLALWTLSPDRLSWTATDHFGQFGRNANDSLLQPDRENLNVFSTGPNLRIPLGSDSNFALGARYGRVSYQRSPFDNERYAADVGYEHVLDTRRSWNVRVLDAHTQYSDVTRRFDIQTASAGYVSTGARGGIDASIGVTSLKDPGGRHSGFFGDIRFDRRLSRSAYLSLDLVDRYADSADVFTRQEDLEPQIQTTVDFIASDSAVRELSGDLALNLVGRRSELAIGAQYFQDKFVGGNVNGDRDSTQLYATAQFRVSPVLSLDGRAQWRKDAPNIGQSVSYSQAGAGVLWNFTRALGLSVEVERYDQSGSVNNYTEMRYLATLRWDIHRRQSPVGMPVSVRPASRRISNPR